MKDNIVDLPILENKDKIAHEMNGMKFTKNFRSATAEEWFVFLPSFFDPQTGGAAGMVIIHYDLLGNKDMFINTTIIFDDPSLSEDVNKTLVKALTEEIINRLVKYTSFRTLWTKFLSSRICRLMLLY